MARARLWIGCAIAAATWAAALPAPAPAAAAQAQPQAPPQQGGRRGGAAGPARVETPPPPPLPPRGVIAGRIVDNITKAPLANARVMLSADCEKPAPPEGPPCTKVLPQNRVVLTSEDGRFRIPDLPAASNFVLRVGRTGYAPRAFGELPPAAMPTMIALKQDEVVENVSVELVPEVVLAGTVLDTDGKPFTGAFVEALRGVYTEGRRELVTVAEAVSDDRGQFRLSQMPPGQYYVSATDPAFADAGDAAGPLFYSPTYYPSATTPEEAVRITLDPGVSREAIVIKLQIIKPARVGGTLRPAMGMTLGAGAIELSPKRNDQYASLSNHRVNIKPDGTYLFENVPPGRYVIRARGETLGEGISMFGTFTMEVTGADKTGVDIEMSPGALVSGYVNWESPALTRARIPADRRSVVIRSPMMDGTLSGDAVTGNLEPEDTFRLKGLLQGNHYFRVEGLPEPWSLKRVELNGADVTDLYVEFRFGQVENGLRVIFTDSAGEIFGTIRPARGDVLDGYAVIVFSTNPTLWIPRSRQVAIQRPRTPAGTYRITGLPAGEYYVAVTRDVDEGDLANPKALQQLAQTPGLPRVQVRDGERKLQDVRPVVKRPAAGAL